MLEDVVSAVQSFFANRPAFELAGFAFTVWGALSAVKATGSFLLRRISPHPNEKAEKSIKRLIKRWNGAISWQRRINGNKALIFLPWLMINVMFMGGVLVWVTATGDKDALLRMMAFITIGFTFLSAGTLVSMLESAMDVEALKNRCSAEVIRIALSSNVMSEGLREAALDRNVPQAIGALKELLAKRGEPITLSMDSQDESSGLDLIAFGPEVPEGKLHREVSENTLQR